MKILHVYKTYLPENFTGVPRVIYEIAEGLNEYGVETEVLTTGPVVTGSPILVEHHKVHVAKRDFHVFSTSLSLSIMSAFKSIAKEADIIHYHFPWPVADILHLMGRPNKPSIVTYHSDVVRQKAVLPFYGPFRDAFLKRVDRIVATSENYVESSDVLQKFRSKVTVIPLGLGERPAVDATLKEQWRSRVGADFFFFIGAFRYYKGLPFLLEAARKTGLPVVLAGFDSLPEKEMKELPSNVKIVGMVSDADKEALLDLARAFVFPSHLRSEAFGIALLEAARSGKPMISCEIGTGTSFVNLKDTTGLVIPPANADSLADAMNTLANDPDRAEAFGRAARERFDAKFQTGLVANEYLKIYRNLMNASQAT